MAKKTFFQAFGATINDAEVAKKGGLSYIAAATAMRLAGRPEVAFVDFNGQPHLEMLGGSVVAVDIRVPDTDAVQRMWLPVMDRDNQTLTIAKTQTTDINNSRQRCLVKAIASVYGDGMSLYLGCDGDGAKAVKVLGVSPDTDLEEVTPVVSTLKEGGAPYVEWGYGLSACRITDPTFYWEVVMWPNAEGQLMPYREVLGSLMVDVDTVYAGKRQRLSLPVMDAAFKPLTVAKATVFDWNKTVMRALTKCIAFNAGYGLGVYADEFGSDKDDAKADGKGRKPAAKAEVKAAAEAPAKVEAAAPEAEAAPVATPAEAAVPAEAVAPEVSEAEVVAANAEAEDARAEVAAEAAEPAVAEAAPAQEAAPAPAPAAPVADSEAVTRFREVMRKRREVNGVAGVITLFDALATSNKFDVADKPACFAVLVTASASLVDEANIIDLVTAIRGHGAMKHLALDTRDMVAAKLTSVMLTAAVAVSDDALKTATEDLVSAGVAQDVNDVFRLAALGNVPAETMDLLKDVMELATA